MIDQILQTSQRSPAGSSKIDSLINRLDYAIQINDCEEIENICVLIRKTASVCALESPSNLVQSCLKRVLAKAMKAAILNGDMNTIVAVHKCGIRLRAMDLLEYKNNARPK